MEAGTLILITADQTALATAGGSPIIAKSTGRATQFVPGIIGLYAETQTVSGTPYARIRLLVAISDKAGKSYAYIWLPESAIQAVPESQFSNYYVNAKSTVNIRLKPDTTAASLLGTLPNKALIGRATDLVKNGFYYVRLAKPINGTSWAWVSTLYATKTAPATGSPAQPSPGSSAPAPSDDTTTTGGKPVNEVIDTTLTNQFGDQGATRVKWAGRILLVLGVAALVWYFVRRHNKRKK